MYQLVWKGFSHSWKARSSSIGEICSQEEPFLDAGLPLYSLFTIVNHTKQVSSDILLLLQTLKKISELMKPSHLFLSKLTNCVLPFVMPLKLVNCLLLPDYRNCFFKHISKSRWKLNWKLIVTYYLVKKATIVNAKTKQQNYFSAPENRYFGGQIPVKTQKNRFVLAHSIIQKYPLITPECSKPYSVALP